MKTIRIFISSPGDVAKERERAREVVESLRRRFSHYFILQPVLWEDLPLQSDTSFQHGIDTVLSENGVDIAIFILWSRLGTPVGHAITKSDGTRYRSGTEREYDLITQARAASLQKEGRARPDILVYTRRDDASFEETLRGTSTEMKDELIQQKKQVEAFLSEIFRDKESGHNIGAYFPFDRPVTFSQRLRVHLQGLLDQMAGESNEVIWDPDKLGPPFLGLEAFQPQHAPVFFGREEEILEARRAFKEQARDGCAFLLLSGASGSGKSSLARAGILPAIVELELDEQVAAWRSVVITPSQLGADPVAALVARLAADDMLPVLGDGESSLPDLVAGLKKDPDLTFKLRIKRAFARSSVQLEGGLRILLVIDQLEELFTVPNLSDDDRDAFLAVVETFARSGSIWVLATVRSDFYQQVQSEPLLVRMKSGYGQLDVLPPGPDALQRLIEEPARLAGLTFEKRGDQSLSSRIIRDAATHAELLPLVEFVLRELYEQRSNHQLTFAAYEDLGGVEGALAKRADEIHAALPGDAQESLAIVLQALITLDNDASGGGGEKIIRQRAPLADFAAKPAARALVDAFITARLFTTCQVEATGEPAVTVAHECLLRVWPRAKAWAEQNKDFLHTRARIAMRMAEGSPLLKGDPLLEAAKAHLLTNGNGFLLHQREWIKHSIATASAQEHQATKLRRLAFASLSILTVLALAGAITGYIKTQQAIAAEAKAAASARDQMAAKEEANDKNTEAARKAHGRARQAFEEGDSRTGMAYLAEAIRYEPDKRFTQLDAVNRLICLGNINPFPLVEPLNHQDKVTSAVFSPDGTRVVSASWDKTARLWDAVSGKPIGEPLRHEDNVISAAFSPDGTRIVTASYDNTARLWDAVSGKPIGEPLRHEDNVNSAVFSPDGTRVVTVSEDTTARLWDAVSGKPVGEPFKHEYSVFSAAFSDDGTRIVTACMDNAARIWDVVSGKPIGEPLRHEDDVIKATFSPDGTRVVTASYDNTARLWDAVSGKPIGEPLRHGDNVNSAAFSPDGTRIVTASMDNTARIWDAASGNPIGQRLRHDNHVSSAAFSPDGTHVITASYDNTACLWDAASGKPIGEPFRHEDDVNSAAFSPDGTHVVTTSWDKTVRLWDIASGKPTGVPLRHEDNVISAAFSPNGTRIVTASHDGTARLWDAVSGKPIGESLRHDGVVNTAAFSPDGSRVVTASYDTTARLWDAVSGKPIGEPLRHEDNVNTAVFSPDGTRVVTVSEDATARLWDAVSGKPVGEPFKHEYSVFSAAFSHDGARIVTASMDNTARIWDVVSGKPIGEPFRHEDIVSSAAFSPDGTRVVTASYDNTARLWDAVSGKPIGEPLGHEDNVISAAFSPDGTRIVTASYDNTARLWDAVSGKSIGEPLRHQDDVIKAAFSPNGTHVVTASWDNTARLWDIVSGKSIGGPLRHDGVVNSAAFSPDKTRIVTASEDRTARLWVWSLMDIKDGGLLSDLLVLNSGREISADGETIESSVSSRLKIRVRVLQKAEQSSQEVSRLIRWIAGPPHDRTISPFGNLTITEHVTREIAWCFDHPQSDQRSAIIREAHALHPAHPLIPFALASIEDHAGRKDFIINYGVKRLPDDPEILYKAATYLHKLEAPATALGVVLNALKHHPDDPDLMAIKAWAESAKEK